MITQDIDRTRIQPRRSRPGVLAIGLILGLGSVPGTRTEARAARLDAAPTNAPLKYPTYLDDQGRVLSGSNTTHSLAARDKAKAAYVAFKLRDGATVSKSVPLMTTKSPVGSDVRRAITAISSDAGRIAVRTQRGLFLINSFRPNQVGANRRVSTSHIATRAQQLEGTGSSSTKPSSTSAGGLNLRNLFDLKAVQNSLASSPLGNLLKLDSPRPTESTTTSGKPPAAIASENSAPSTSGVMIPISLEIQPAPVPEPGTLAFAGLVIGGAALREGLRRRRAARAERSLR